MATADRILMVRSCWLLCSLGLAGCLQLEQTVTLGADGAGTQELTLTLPASTFAELKRAAAANQGGVAADPQALFTAATVRQELAGAGLELSAHDVQERDGARTVKLQARFASPEVLRKSPLAGSAAEWTFAPGPSPGTVEVTLWPQGRQAWIDARAKADAMRTAKDAVAGEFFERRRAQLEGLDVTLRLCLPGKVLRCTRNLDVTGECEVTARITAAQIRTPEDLVRRLAPRFQVVFDAGGCPGFPQDR
jgi:hypothetical protein